MNYQAVLTTGIYIGLLYSTIGCSSTHPTEKRQTPTESQILRKMTPGRDITEEADRILKMIKEDIFNPNKL